MERIEKDTSSKQGPDEIDLSELVKTLYRRKLLISIIALLCSFTSLYYAYFLVVPKYESIAIFNIKDAEKSTLNLTEMRSLARFSGISNLSSKSENILDQINGADFLRQVVENEKLYLDPEFFRPPSEIDESWLNNKKTFLKKKLGLYKEPRSFNQAETVNAVVKQLATKFVIKETKNGAFEISVTSTNAATAAFLANTLMNTYLKVRAESVISSNERFLSYLEETLSSRKKDLDETVDKIESFMLARNILSKREFTLQAGKLKEFREKIKEIEKNIDELTVFGRFMNETTYKNPNLKAELNRLYSLAPQLKSLTFNKSNGDLSDLNLVLQIIRKLIPEEIARRKRSVEATTIGYEKLANRAKKSALDARELAELTRDAEGKQLIFESVAKQVGANQISDGFQKSMDDVYQTAMISTEPIQPSKVLTLAISTVLGLFFGSLITILGSSLSKKIWTVKKIRSLGIVNNITEVKTRFYGRSALKNKSAVAKVRCSSKIDTFKLNKLCFDLSHLATEPSQENKFLCLIDFGQEPLIGLSPVLASIFADSGKKVMLLDVTYKNSLSRSRLVKENLKNKSEFLLTNVSYERLAPPAASSDYVKFRKNIDSLKIKYSQSHDYIITMIDNVENENTSMLELFTQNTLLFLTKAGQLSESNISSIRSIINEKVHASVFILFFNK